ncbi:MAG: branched-chain amino acid aminotransferase [Pseudomonadota bacterium]|jgi:branched-chain amino acid aminotransferase|nr:branched-chain amino acid aminotransferase [Pseudomonadota bacterium]MEC9077901.1 branched-chain amino acid aminotransferase [Pseudomonadota bacterium]
MLNFDDQDGQIWYDGALRPWRSANLHVLTHGLHYGSCVFEGERVYNNRVFKLREHTERLLRSANYLGFEIPWTLQEVADFTIQTVKAQGYSDAYVRPVAWRGSEMMGVSAQDSKIHLAIAVWEWPSYFSPEARMKGIKLDWSKWKRPSPESAPVHAKAAGLYMICTLSKHEAEAKGYDDALMLDWRGQVAETTGANIFLVMDGALHTPKPDCFLDGITRRSVIELAKTRGYQIIERSIMPEELAKADEIFVTGTAAEVTPVGCIGNQEFTVGPVTIEMLEDYDRLVRSAVP